MTTTFSAAGLTADQGGTACFDAKAAAAASHGLPSVDDALSGNGLPEALADGILAGAGLSNAQAARNVLRLHIARTFDEAGRGRSDPAGDGGNGSGEPPATPGCLRTAAATAPKSASLATAAGQEAGVLAAVAPAVPNTGHGELVRSLGTALLIDIGEDGTSARQAAEMLAKALVAQLALVAAPEVDARPVARGGLAPHILRRVTERMVHDLAEDLDLSTLAAEARLSPWHFARAFKQSTGEPPHAYRTRLRIEHAKSLLSLGDARVAVIAEAVGYDSAHSLARAFRKLAGCSPSAFRREVRAPSRAAAAGRAG